MCLNIYLYICYVCYRKKCKEEGGYETFKMETAGKNSLYIHEKEIYIKYDRLC